MNVTQNFAVAEEQKRQRQIEDFIRRSEPTAGRVTWIDRLNPYRYFDAQRGAVKVEALPPNLVLPLKQANAPDVGLGAAGVCSYPFPPSIFDLLDSTRKKTK